VSVPPLWAFTTPPGGAARPQRRAGARSRLRTPGPTRVSNPNACRQEPTSRSNCLSSRTPLTTNVPVNPVSRLSLPAAYWPTQGGRPATRAPARCPLGCGWGWCASCRSPSEMCSRICRGPEERALQPFTLNNERQCGESPLQSLGPGREELGRGAAAPRAPGIPVRLPPLSLGEHLATGASSPYGRASAMIRGQIRVNQPMRGHQKAPIRARIGASR